MADPHNNTADPGADRYAALTPAGKLLAQVYGVIAPQPVGVKRARRIFSEAGITLDGRRLSEGDIRHVNSELIAAGIAMRLDAAGNKGVCATPHCAVELTRRAHEDGRMQRILAAFETTSPGYGADPYLYDILFRCYVVGGDFDHLDKLTAGDLTADDWRMFAEPLATDVLRTLPERYIDLALTGCLRHVVATAADPEPVVQGCQHLTGRPERHAADIAYIRVLQGRFDEAEGVFAGLPPDAQASRAARTGLAATRGLVALLRGDSLAAWREIDAALAAEKAGTRKRNAFPDHAAFALSLLALVRLDTPESLALLNQLLRVAERQGIQRYDELSLVADAARLEAGHETFGFGSTGSALETLFDGFRDCWTRSYYRNLSKWLERLNAIRHRASVNGFKWVEAECVSTLHRFAELRNDLGERVALPEELPDPAPAHAELGTRTLTVLVEPLAEWERSLKALEQLAYDANQKEQNRRTASTPVEKRLVWEVDDGGYEVSLSPREQRRNKNGTWSKGRRVALKRLATQAGSLGFLLDEDVA
ncbi:MAG: hypothetical protein OXE40_00600, partial [Gammaproteobacteria bacterium]|nr:hypothetical protein [Gammaproteobacteria bacterium]